MSINITEHTEQAELMRWTLEGSVQEKYPELEYLFAIPNGAKLPFYRDARGNRRCNQALILKAEGLKSGIPDLFLPVPAGWYHGLFIEMKSTSKTAKVRPEQQAWIEKLKQFGYQAVVCRGVEAAKQEIINYLRNGQEE